MLPLRHLNKHDENFKICMSCLTLLCTHIENMNAGDWISMRHLTHIAASAGLAHTKMHSKYIKMKAKQKRKEKNEHRRGWGIEIKTKYANWNMKNERNVLVGEKNTPTNERTNELSGEYTIKCWKRWKKIWYAVVVVIAAYDFDGRSVERLVGLSVDCLRGVTKAWIAGLIASSHNDPSIGWWQMSMRMLCFRLMLARQMT